MNADEPTERRTEWGFMLSFALLAAALRFSRRSLAGTPGSQQYSKP